MQNNKHFIVSIFLLLSLNIFFSLEVRCNNLKQQQIKDSISIERINTINKYFKNENYTKSLELALILLNNLKDKNTKLEFECCFLIGNIFRKRNNNKKALEYFKKSLELINKLDKNSPELGNSLNSNIDKAKTLLRIGTQYSFLKKKDSARNYYLKIVDLELISNELIDTKAKAYNNLSGTYIEDSIYDKATFYAKKAIDLHKKRNRKVATAGALNNLANIYLKKKDYYRAKETYSQALDLIINDDSIEAIKNKEYLYYNLAWTLYLLKDYKAYEYQEKSYILKDTLTEREIRRIVKGVFEKHKVDLEKSKVNLVKEKRKLVEAQKSKTNILFGTLSLLVIVISGGIIYNYKLRQRNLRLKLSENNLIQQQRIEKIKSDAQTKILNATIDAKESERKQIAETLHDNVSALLSSANMHLSATKKHFTEVTPLEIEKTQAIILEASQKVRDLSHNLISSILLKFGLEYALKDVAKKFSNSELKFEVTALNINRYNQEFEIKIFNIIQELANNILKHSKANYAEIVIKQEKNQLTVLVNDDGVGFSTSSSSFKNNGIGLTQIEARIEMMNGKFTIVSEKNKGTKIAIFIPVQEQKIFKLSSVS